MIGRIECDVALGTVEDFSVISDKEHSIWVSAGLVLALVVVINLKSSPTLTRREFLLVAARLILLRRGEVRLPD
jgi:hypothetical protein